MREDIHKSIFTCENCEKRFEDDLSSNPDAKPEGWGINRHYNERKYFCSKECFKQFWDKGMAEQIFNTENPFKESKLK